MPFIHYSLSFEVLLLAENESFFYLIFAYCFQSNIVCCCVCPVHTIPLYSVYRFCTSNLATVSMFKLHFFCDIFCSAFKYVKQKKKFPQKLLIILLELENGANLRAKRNCSTWCNPVDGNLDFEIETLLNKIPFRRSSKKNLGFKSMQHTWNLHNMESIF